ncbi:MAG: AEC family transporter [Sedimenticolaceae bacterium]|jgi:predicted permease
MSQVISIIFPIFAIVLAGFLYARYRGTDMVAANRLNIEIFTPALIFSILSSEGFDLVQYADLAIGTAIVVLGTGLLVWPLTRLFNWPLPVFLPPMMFNNSGNMGLPLALFAFGEKALPAAMIMFLVENTLHFSVGNGIVTKSFSPLKLLRMPMLVATFAGIAVSMTQFPIWSPLAKSIDLLGEICIPLMLFSLGVRMTGVNLKDWQIGLTGAVLGPAVSVAIAVAILPWLNLSELETAQLIVFAALPPAVLNYLVAERYDIDPPRVAAIVLLGNLASVVVIPLALLWVL